MQSHRILIIDDEEAAIFGYTRYLTKAGFTVSSATHLKEGLDKLSKEEFEAVVLDVHLPDGNSIDLIPKIRAKSKHLKIFVVTGLNDTDTSEKAIRHGADEFLVKPIAIKELCAAITAALKTAR